MISFKVVGTTFRNHPDPLRVNWEFEGSVNGHDELSTKGFLVPEPENPYDSNAIAVKFEDGVHLGYIPKDVAHMLTTYKKIADKKDCVIKKVVYSLKDNEPTGKNDSYQVIFANL